MILERWQKVLSRSFYKVQELLKFLLLPVNVGNLEAEKNFKTKVPLSFALRIKKRNFKDPILLQVLAVKKELEEKLNYVKDPLKEKNINVEKGLLHKYHGRVLLILTGSCAVNCRYCFRKFFSYKNNTLQTGRWDYVLNYINKNSSIKEVILSGGDPLLVSNKVLFNLFNKLNDIDHLKIIRIHTRIPVVFPERIDKSFLDILHKVRLQKVIVLHINHPQELDNSILSVCTYLKSVGCYLYNQSVLLKNINNDVNILVKLSYCLFSFGIFPYYLHLLDKVEGISHFDVHIDEAKCIYRELQKKLPGYLVPKLVYENPECLSKVLIS
ncbi:EF-P beta-lysylation protein EpmB [Candidatus Legionella polyplacis]|uniref:L-lysine 2,3-aminomutase n=1 Tax=Candidatus Legionella polyplacis TaxID=2005262 RepID=A0ABZ2GZ79_9GAMM